MPLRSMLLVLLACADASPVDAPAAQPEPEAGVEVVADPSELMKELLAAGQAVDDQARAVGAQKLGVDARSLTVSPVLVHASVRAYVVSGEPGRAGVVLVDGKPIADIAALRSTSHGEDALVMASAVVVLHDESDWAPLRDNKFDPAVWGPRFGGDGTLSYLYDDPRGRGKRFQADVSFADDGSVAEVKRTEILD